MRSGSFLTGAVISNWADLLQIEAAIVTAIREILQIRATFTTANRGRVITHSDSYYILGQLIQIGAQQQRPNIKILKFPRSIRCLKVLLKESRVISGIYDP